MDMLKAPSSFRRFMEATNRTKKQQAKRERQRLISQGLEVSDDEQDLFFSGLESLKTDIESEKARVEAGVTALSSDDDEDEDLNNGKDKEEERKREGGEGGEKERGERERDEREREEREREEKDSSAIIL